VTHRSGRHFLQIPGPTNVPDRVLRAIDRALSLTTHLVPVSYVAGVVRLCVGDGEAAIAHFERAMRISPLDPASGAFIVGTGLATMMEFPVLNVVTPNASFGTGIFKIMRTTLVGMQDASRFQPGIPGLPTAMSAPSQMFGYPLPSGYTPRP